MAERHLGKPPTRRDLLAKAPKYDLFANGGIEIIRDLCPLPTSRGIVITARIEVAVLCADHNLRQIQTSIHILTGDAFIVVGPGAVPIVGAVRTRGIIGLMVCRPRAVSPANGLVAGGDDNG